MPPREKDESIGSENYKSHTVNFEATTITNEKAWLFEDALKLIGFGYIQYFSMFLGGLILLAVINETMGMMMIITSAQCDLKLSSSEKGIVSAVGFVGIMIPAYMWGYLADTRGRKRIMTSTLLCTNLAAICSSIAPSFTLFLICRFVVGFFISAASSSVYAYLGEFNTIKNRSAVIAWASMSVGVAALYIPCMAWLILSNDFRLPLFGVLDYRPWRLLLLAYTLPGFLGALFLLTFKESPRYFMAQGREEDALKVLQWIYKKNTGEPIEYYPVKRLIPEIEPNQKKAKAAKGFVAIVKSMWKQTKPLFRKPLCIHLLINCYMMFAVFFASGGIGIWFADIQNKVSTSNFTGTVCQLLNSGTHHHQIISENGTLNDTLDEVCDDTIPTKVYIDSIILGGYYTAGMFIISLLIKRVGRGWILVFCLFGSGISGLLLLWLTDPILTVTSFSCFLVLSGVSISLVSNGAVSLFPTHVRAMAVCIILMTGRFGTTVGSNIVGFIIDSHCEFTFAFFSCVVIVAGMLNFFLPFR